MADASARVTGWQRLVLFWCFSVALVLGSRCRLISRFSMSRCLKWVRGVGLGLFLTGRALLTAASIVGDLATNPAMLLTGGLCRASLPQFMIDWVGLFLGPVGAVLGSALAWWVV
jgi:hypothetical protein